MHEKKVWSVLAVPKIGYKTQFYTILNIFYLLSIWSYLVINFPNYLQHIDHDADIGALDKTLRKGGIIF